MTLSSVESILFSGTDKDKIPAKNAAALVLRYVKQGIPFKPPVVYPVDYAVRSFSYGRLEPDAKPSMQAFMSPLVHAAFCPAQSLGNEEQMVDKRVTSLKAPNHNHTGPEFPRVNVPMHGKALETTTTFLDTGIDLFNQLFFGEYRHTLVPVELDVVYERQPRPSQRAILDAAEGLTLELRNFARPFLSFMKREAYPKVTDPRPITTVPHVLKRDMSKYAYAMQEVFKDMPWYAFGITPVEIAERVADICQKSQRAAVTDFSRFDGHKDAIMGVADLRIMLHLFHPRYHEEIRELHYHTMRGKAVTTKGVSYDTGTSTISGEPRTSLKNTYANALMMFLAVYLATKDAEMARSYLMEKFVAGGDDGLAGDPPVQEMIKITSWLNHTLTIDVIERGMIGITFLSRVYSPEVWVGNPNSMSEVFRAAAKFHVTPVLPETVTPSAKLLEKARSLYLTDRNTPIIGPLVTAIHKVTNGFSGPTLAEEHTRTLSRWGDQFSQTVQYPNDCAEWSQLYLDADPRLHTYSSEVLTNALAECRKLEDFLRLPLVVEIPQPSVKEQAVVGDEIVDAEAKEQPASKPKPARKAKPRRPVVKLVPKGKPAPKGGQ